jgi:hypothetical protein
MSGASKQSKPLAVAGIAALALLALSSGKSKSKGSDSADVEPEPFGNFGASPPPMALVHEITPRASEYPFLSFAAIDVGNYPTPGLFHQAAQNGSLSGVGDDYPGHHVAYQALLSAGYLAQAHGLLKPGQDARSFANSKAMRDSYAELVVCSPFNDAFYSQANGTTPPGWVKGPAGRTIAFNPRHADMLAMLNARRPLVRTISANNGMRLANLGTPSTSTPLLWLPPINLAKLVEGEVTTLGIANRDGSSAIIPPPEVMQHVEESGTISPFNGCN